VTQADGMYFFGVWTGDRAGHYLYDQNGRPVWGNGILPWRAIDGVLQPNAHDPYVFVPMAQQVQGEAMLHHKGGWTALCFWDRSEDRRAGCNANFFAKGTHDFAQMVHLSKNAFPDIWRRFTFDVVRRPESPGTRRG
jgi:hypothetical protein